jgi:flagellar basal body-associated protein FliL
VSEPQKQKQDKSEHLFAIVLVLIAGLIVTCVVVITIGLMKFGAKKQIECRCPDGSTVTEVTSAIFEPEQVCPAICTERQKRPAP